MTIQKLYAWLLLALAILLSACSSPPRVAQFDRRLDLPLVLSIEQGKHHEALALLDKGADPNGADPIGRTALMYAGINGQTDTMELLIQRGAQVNAKDRKGITPLHSAIMFGDPAAVRLLIDKGADLNAKFDMGGAMSGLTALKLARLRERTAPELRSSDVLARGRLIYHSIKSDYEKIIEMLERAGAVE